MTIRDIRPAEALPKLERTLEQLRSNPGPASGRSDWKHRRKDGSLLDVEISSHDLGFMGREARLVMAVDVTEHRRAQQELHASQRLLQTVFDTIPHHLIVKDRESRLIAVNEPYILACGKEPRELVGKTDMEIWPPYLALKYRADDREVMNSGQRKRVEEPFKDKKGCIFWVETIKTPIFNERQEVIGTAGIARDITERRRMEEALRQVSRALKAVTECHQALLRATNEAELLNEVCRIIVEVQDAARPDGEN